MRRGHRLPFGAEVVPGGVRFRLWAPGVERLTLVLDEQGGESHCAMNPAGEGWFELVTAGARAGTRYHYRLADGTRIPDPASRFQPQDVTGASEVVDPLAYEWQDAYWRGRPWHEAVVYELHVGCFAGDFDGVCKRLEHLERLGVTAIELMPVADFAGARNWGYDGVLPYAPDSAYGRPENLKRLVETCHAHGLMVLLDVVYNHFGPSGNYLARYAPGFFTERVATPWGQAIDFSRPPVREFFIHNALYWLAEYHFDGLRFDAVDRIHDESPVHILEEIAATVRAQIPDRQLHLVLENDDNRARYLERMRGVPPLYTAQWNDDFHHAAHLLASGEHDGYYADYTAAPVAKLACALAEGFIYQGEYSAYRGRQRGERSAQLPPLAFVNFLQNHDQVGNRAFGERLTALAEKSRLRALYAMLLLSPPVPLLFMGEEWATATPFLFFCDFGGDLGVAVREGRRREFARFAAFRDAVVRARIPDPTASASFARSQLNWNEARQAPHAEWLGFVSELVSCRQRELVPQLSGIASGRSEMLSQTAFSVAWPLTGGGFWRLSANLGAAPVAVPARSGRIVYAVPAVTSAKLAPNAVRVSRDGE